jgi:response regulator NasT
MKLMPRSENKAVADPANLRVMLVDDDAARAALVARQLDGCGYEVVTVMPSASSILHQIQQHRPRIVLMDIALPDRDMLESLALLNVHQPIPVVMFTQQDDPTFIRRAVDAGVSTYLVGNIDCKRVMPVIEVALAQFRNWQTMRSELEATRAGAEDRKIIERAKGLLMAHNSIDESEAHKTLTRLAMNANKTLPAVAQTVIGTLSTTRSGTK